MHFYIYNNYRFVGKDCSGVGIYNIVVRYINWLYNVKSGKQRRYNLTGEVNEY
jgi:hypothetical protein